MLLLRSVDLTLIIGQNGIHHSSPFASQKEQCSSCQLFIIYALEKKKLFMTPLLLNVHRGSIHEHGGK